MSNVLKRIWRLTSLCIKGPGGKVALIYGVIVLLLNLLEIQIGLKLIEWSKDFYGALERYNAQDAVKQIGVFVVLIAINATQYVTATYIRQLMQIRWRTTLTNASLDRWMGNKAYWHLNTSDASALDNPDQRVAEDCRVFVGRLTGEALDLFTGLVGLVTYVVLLWNLSDFSIEFHLFGHLIQIKHYIVWAAPIYVLICSGLTHWLGAPLMKLNVIQQQREADFRFSLTRFRESKEAIALENGEQVERDIADKRYSKIIENWRKRIKREFILGCFTRPYMYSVLRVPLFLSFPAYFVGHVTLGGLMQLAAAFQKVVTTLSWFIFSYKNLAELAASSTRLVTFLDAIDEVNRKTPAINLEYSDDDTLSVEHLSIQDPQGNQLIHLPELKVKSGETVWIEGPSGMGKSTLFKSIAGLWDYCSGTVKLPKGKILFLPQKPYSPLGGLVDSVSYPDTEQNPEKIRTLLQQVGLNKNNHIEQFARPTGVMPEHIFSGGEQQRLIFARILYTKPDWVFLDEATSALDTDAEQQLYALLRESLPHTGFIVIAHRKPCGLGKLKRIPLKPC